MRFFECSGHCIWQVHLWFINMRSRELILVEKPIFQILSEVNYFLVIVPELDDLPIFAIHESKTKMLVFHHPRTQSGCPLQSGNCHCEFCNCQYYIHMCTCLNLYYYSADN
jgi:hypothetical protein